MWRQVLSQSPSTVPHDGDSARKTHQYLESWKALGVLLHSGRSLSGHERNCCFLNTGHARFADASAATGLDFADDSRGLAPVDWDGDGDLDVWITNRTAPRVRYYQNDGESDNRYLAIKLRGVTCNRDAIGARVIVQVGGTDLPLVQTLAAGEGFLSQTSKWLHFGLGPSGKIESVRVQWPGGQTQSFVGIQANNRYLITQGHQQAEVWRLTKPSAPLVARSLGPMRMDESRRIALARRIPLPAIAYHDFDGGTQSATQSGWPLLVNLWASWCQPCIAELAAWKEATEDFRKTGLTVKLLNVDHAQSDIRPRHLDEIRKFHQRLGLPFDGGLIDRSNAELIEIVQQTLLLRQHALPIPTSLLLDRQGRLAVLYEGPVPLPQLMDDVHDLDADAADPRDRAVPFLGRWLTEPFPVDLFTIPDRLIAYQRGNEAYAYVKSHILGRRDEKQPDAWREYGVKPNKVVDILTETARLILADGNFDGAIELLEHAVLFAPEDWNLHVTLAHLLIARKRSADAIRVSQQMAQMRPKHPLPWNNIAWVLATSEQESVRDTKRAIEVAEDICRRTNYREPTALDTLAVAYAADGRFEDAVKVAEQAIAHCRELNLEKMIETIRARLRLYQQRRPFRP